MLDQSRFLAMKNLAKDVRKENEEKFRSFESESVDDAINDKNEFVNKTKFVIMGTSFLNLFLTIAQDIFIVKKQNH